VLHRASSLERELQRGKRQTKDIMSENRKRRWQGKRLNGQFPRSLETKLVDIEHPYRWLKLGDMKGERERERERERVK
jgi:hypothetical protein